MPTVTVEVEIEDFSTDDLIDELSSRRLTTKQQRDFRNALLNINTVDKEIKLDEFLEKLK